MPTGTVPIVPQEQLNLGPAAWFRPEPEAVPGNQIIVKAGFAYRGSHTVVDRFTAGDQTTAGFASVSGAGFKRYDLVYIDGTGAATIFQGNEVATAAPQFDGAPGFNLGPNMPDSAAPVAYILVDEVGAVTVDKVDIFQVNGLFQITRDIFGYLVDKGLFGSAPAGASDVVTALFAAEASGGGTTALGVVTAPPENYVWLVDQNGDEILHSTGARMFGRLTEAATVWTLTYFYINASGVETSMDPSADTSGPAPTDVRLVGVGKAFSKNDPNRPLFDSTVSRLSDQVVGTIPDATTTVKGKVELATDLENAASVVVQGNDQRVNSPIQGKTSGGAAVGGRYDSIKEGAGIAFSDGGGGDLVVTAAAAGTKLRQVLADVNTAVVICVVIPFDDTVPLVSEGTLVNSLAITVLNNTKCKIDFSCFAGSGANNITAALFEGSTCLYAIGNDIGNSNETLLSFSFLTGALSAGSHTFRVRVGAGGGNVWVNGNAAGTRRYGGAGAASLVVAEVLA